MNPKRRNVRRRSPARAAVAFRRSTMSKRRWLSMGAEILFRAVGLTISSARLVIELVTEAQARIAREAYRDFGKGTGHRAGLNFGDCFAYALARAMSEPILFKGNDFRHTDLTPVLE